MKKETIEVYDSEKSRECGLLAFLAVFLVVLIWLGSFFLFLERGQPIDFGFFVVSSGITFFVIIAIISIVRRYDKRINKIQTEKLLEWKIDRGIVLKLLTPYSVLSILAILLGYTYFYRFLLQRPTTLLLNIIMILFAFFFLLFFFYPRRFIFTSVGVMIPQIGEWNKFLIPWNKFKSYTTNKNNGIIRLNSKSIIRQNNIILITKDNFNEAEKIISRYLGMKK